MLKQSAGILLYKKENGQLLFFLIHPGGPFFKNKDNGVWSIPKGEYLDDEGALTAARREFKEETGFDIDGDFRPLKPVKQKSGKIVTAWAVEGDVDPSHLKSNMFEMEWPPKSGKMQSFVEVDRGAWFDYSTAIQKINPAQVGLLDETTELLKP